MNGNEFWSRVKLRLKELDKRQDWLAEKTGMQVQSLRNMIHSEKLPTLTKTLAILKALNLSWEELELYPDIKKTDKANVFTIPVLEYGTAADQTDKPTDYLAVPTDLIPIMKNLQATYIHGDAMEPTFSDGDKIIYDTNGYNGEDGIYTITYMGKEFVKRLQMTSSGIKISSDNRKYEPITETEDGTNFKVIGRVRYVMHKCA